MPACAAAASQGAGSGTRRQSSVCLLAGRMTRAQGRPALARAQPPRDRRVAASEQSSRCAGPIGSATQSHLAMSGQQPYTFVQGQVAAGVTGVTLVLSDRSNVQATMAGGSFVAWWPGSAG